MEDSEKNQSGTQIGSPGGPKVGAIGPFFGFFLKNQKYFFLIDAYIDKKSPSEYAQVLSPVYLKKKIGFGNRGVAQGALKWPKLTFFYSIFVNKYFFSCKFKD